MPTDLEAWQQRVRYFPAHPATEKQESHAVSIIEDFLHDDAEVSVSWGKDSVAVAHLATLADPKVKIHWVRARHLEPQDTLDVRDAFLESHPHVDYRETTVDIPVMRGEAGFPGQDWDMLGSFTGKRTISGVRAAESKTRTLSAKVHGHTTKNTCRPMLNWSTMQVFNYLHTRGLPIHRAYQHSFGGVLSLDDIRVHTLGTATMHGSSYWERMTKWEDHYYSDTIREALSARKRT